MQFYTRYAEKQNCHTAGQKVLLLILNRICWCDVVTQEKIKTAQQNFIDSEALPDGNSQIKETAVISTLHLNMQWPKWNCLYALFVKAELQVILND